MELGSKHYVLAFDQYLLDVKDQVYVKPPRVMVDEGDWDDLCEYLLCAGVFARIHEEDIYQANNMPLLNGLFGVSKQEYTADGVEIMRIIMSLTPVNAICRGSDSDIATLPTWATMSPLQLEINEDLVISSEDVIDVFSISSAFPPVGILSWPSIGLCPNGCVRGRQDVGIHVVQSYLWGSKIAFHFLNMYIGF